MKKILLFFLTAAMFATAVSQIQTRVIKFTGHMVDGTYVRMDSVKVESLYRSWTEVLTYPDTVLIFDSVQGLAQVRNSGAELKAYPNPFCGNTSVSVQLEEADNVVVQICNLAGRKVVEFSRIMEAGKYLFDVSLKIPQVYLCSVRTSRGTSTVKLVNTAAAGKNSMTVKGLDKNSLKRFTIRVFRDGDILQCTGYATRNNQKCESDVLVREQRGSGEIALTFVDSTVGVLPGVFSVDTGRYVRFSQGNLQWSATGGGTTATIHTVAGGGIADGTWRFALHQWDIIGNANSNISSSYAGWIDLFGWGTSGYNSEFPYTSNNVAYYGNCNGDLSGTNFDWGLYNPISNGGNWPGVWRTLTEAEWNYLFVLRPRAGTKFGMACVNGVNGLVILPDSWVLPSGLTFNSGVASGNGSQYYAQRNSYTAAQWQQMEANGAVFLPAAGIRNSTTINNVGTCGFYWSSVAVDNFNAYCLYFRSHEAYSSSQNPRYYGESVRLVQDY